MINNIIRYILKYRFRFLLLLITSVILYSCASIASPEGGDYDFDPPKLVRTIPEMNATNVTTNKIELVFDELIQLEKASEKVIVTPPQKRNPNIQAISNRIRVELRDTLLPNTTYTIDFTDAIVDNNEGNPFENFAFSFSTGDNIDTLAVSGKVLSADNLEPVKGIYVGLHKDLNDSAFTKKPFDRISRTNDRGEFTIRGIAEGEYKIYALDDINRSYKYENRANAIAFDDSIISPSFTQAFRTDTVFNLKTLEADSVITIPYTRFIPDNIVLRSFNSSFKRQYLQKHERPASDQLKIFFGAPTDMPDVKPLNFEASDWGVLERNMANDTLHYWIIDPEVAKIDTLLFQVTYNRTDSLDNLVQTTDSLRFIDRTKKKNDTKKKKNEKEEITFLQVTNNLKSVIDVYDTIQLTFSLPVIDYEKDKFTLQRLVDSTYIDEPFEVIRNEYNPRKYSFIHKWQPATEYKFTLDSATIHSYNGLWNDKLESKFKTKTLDEYGALYIAVNGLETETPVFMQLLNGSDKPVRQEKVIFRKKQGEWAALFMRLIPGKYYARIIFDTNNNGIWDTGDYYEKRQPEMVYYYNSSFDVRQGWEQEESWDINAVELDKQKPLDITKNKPQEKESRRKQLEQQDKKRSEEEKRNRESINQFDNPQSNRRTTQTSY